MQLGKLDLIGRRKEVRPGRQDLSELDEGWAQLFERTAYMLGAGEGLFVSPIEEALQRHKALKAGNADQEAKPVPGEHLADLPVAAGLRLNSDVSQRSSASLGYSLMQRQGA